MSHSTEIVKNRWLGFLIWQSITSTAIYFSTPPISSYSSYSISILSFFSFHLSLILFYLSLFLLSSPHPHPSASFSSFFISLFKSLFRLLLLFLAGGGSPPSPSDYDYSTRRRVRRTLVSAAFVAIAALSGSLAVISVAGENGLGSVGVGLGGAVLGLVFVADYLYLRRWVFKFPIIQRPIFYSFKMGLSSSLKQALKISTLAFSLSTILLIFLPNRFKSKSTVGQFAVQLMYFYVAISAVSLCWELSHHLLQVVHTKRCSFAPPQGSAAAETNPSEPLLEALEQSNPRSLLQYLAYLDLCMVSESDVEPWRRAAFFEESGETYRRIISVCLRPLEQLTAKLAEGLEGISMDKSDMLSQQLVSPTDSHGDSGLHEAFNGLQLCTWCARTVAALTARSRWEDRFGVAQLTGCNSAVVSTLLYSLMAVEACLGKKTNTPPAQFMGPASIRWATGNTIRRDVQTPMASKKRGGALYDKAYALADVLRTSIYEVVSAFQADMQANVKASVLDKNWIMEGKPLYGTRNILVKKLSMFLDFRAN